MNYQKEMEKIIGGFKEEKPTLLLHGCCAPCSSYVLEYLSEFFAITLYFYNPNISTEEEFIKRQDEAKRLIDQMELKSPVSFISETWDSQEFYDIANGYEDVKEGGERCFRCYELRLRKTANKAKEEKFDYFTTTLSISPLKNSQKLNEIGKMVGEEMGVKHLPSDFKKKEGYKRSIVLSGIHGLYRQNYCGCIYSQNN